MKIQASFVQDGKWWGGWTDDVPSALTQGATLEEARENLIDAVRMMRQPVDLSKLPRNKIVIEQLEGLGETTRAHPALNAILKPCQLLFSNVLFLALERSQTIPAHMAATN